MPTKPKPIRKNLRLKTYDYSAPGAYFITICVHEKKCLFGKVLDDKMMLNAIGEVVEKWWNKLPSKFPNIELDQYIIMPNHFHGIINVGADPCIRPLSDLSIVPGNGPIHGSAPTIARMIQWFKIMTTNECIKISKQNNAPFSNKIWQRNYYEHIIRNEKSLAEIREYIVGNPCKWQQDSLFIAQ